MVYGLSIPVKTADPEHIKALRYFAAVYDAMAVALKADLNYSGLLTKKPNTRKMAHRVGLQRSIRAFRACGIRRPHPSTKRAESDSRALGAIALFSINCACGHTSLFASIGLAPLLLGVRLFMPKRKAAMSLRALSVNEVRAIGKSVAKWVWARDADAEAKFIAKQVKEGRNGGKANSSASQAIKGAKGGKAKGLANFNKRGCWSFEDGWVHAKRNCRSIGRYSANHIKLAERYEWLVGWYLI